MISKLILIAVIIVTSINTSYSHGHKKNENKQKQDLSKKDILKYRKIFESNNEDVISEVLHNFKHNKVPELREDIINLIKETKSFKLQKSACLALVHYKDKATIKLLTELMDNNSKTISIIAAEVLYKQGNIEVESKILASLNSNIPEVRKEAISSIVYLKLPTALEKLRNRKKVENVDFVIKEINKGIMILE